VSLRLTAGRCPNSLRRLSLYRPEQRHSAWWSPGATTWRTS